MPEDERSQEQRIIEARKRLLEGADVEVQQGQLTVSEMVEIFAQLTGVYLAFLGSQAMTSQQAMDFAIRHILIGNREASNSLKQRGYVTKEPQVH